MIKTGTKTPLLLLTAVFCHQSAAEDPTCLSSLMPVRSLYVSLAEEEFSSVI